MGSGRTDTGVHATQQFCHFDLPIQVDIKQAPYKLNSILPDDIAVIDLFQVPAKAHARFDAISRSYNYFISSYKDPFKQHLSYYFRPKLDIVIMNSACDFLLEVSNFKSFSKVKTSVENFNCKILEAKWKANNEGYRFYVSANRFLRGMVRAIVGTLLDLGTGRLNMAQFKEIVESGDRKKAGRSVPPHGLFLSGVEYPAGILNTN